MRMILIAITKQGKNIFNIIIIIKSSNSSSSSGRSSGSRSIVVIAVVEVGYLEEKVEWDE